MFDAFDMMCDNISSVCRAAENYDRAKDIADAMYVNSRPKFDPNPGWTAQRQQALMNSIIRNNKR